MKQLKKIATNNKNERLIVNQINISNLILNIIKILLILNDLSYT